MSIRLNEITSGNGNSSVKVEENISVLNEIVGSLKKAATTLQTIKDSETNFLFKKLELSFPKEGIDFHKAKKLYEINLIKQALRQTGGHQVKAAQLLKMRPSTLNSIIKKHDINWGI